jgi:hypothetical protein
MLPTQWGVETGSAVALRPPGSRSTPCAALDLVGGVLTPRMPSTAQPGEGRSLIEVGGCEVWARPCAPGQPSPTGEARGPRRRRTELIELAVGIHGQRRKGADDRPAVDQTRSGPNSPMRGRRSHP